MPPLDMLASSPVICPSTKCVVDDFPVSGKCFHTCSICRAGT